MAEVQVIPPKAARPDTLRVAAYCRVSSDSADQLHSYAAQIRAYTQAINAHDTQSTIRFQLYGGFEFQETLEA